jgi:glycerol-3-phosphate O-acyltransferase
VNGAIVELALLRAAEEDVDDPAAEFWEETLRLRDLLKFEFFFEEKEVFRGELVRELALHDAEWEARLAEGAEAVQALARRIRPFNAHRVLRPFLDAYRLLGDHLERCDPDETFDAGRCVDACMALGRQYHLQRRIGSTASVSQVLVRSAQRLAENRGLLTSGDPDLAARRRAFAQEIRDALRRVDAIEALAATRRAGLID